jgi:hypothetical protein
MHKKENTMHSVDARLDDAMEFSQPYYPDRKLTSENAREITDILDGFFKLLIEWDRAKRAANGKDPKHDLN